MWEFLVPKYVIIILMKLLKKFLHVISVAWRIHNIISDWNVYILTCILWGFVITKIVILVADHDLFIAAFVNPVIRIKVSWDVILYEWAYLECIPRVLHLIYLPGTQCPWPFPIGLCHMPSVRWFRRMPIWKILLAMFFLGLSSKQSSAC